MIFDEFETTESTIKALLKMPVTIKEFTTYSPVQISDIFYYPFRAFILLNYDGDSLDDCWKRANDICNDLNNSGFTATISKFHSTSFLHTCSIDLMLDVTVIYRVKENENG